MCYQNYKKENKFSVEFIDIYEYIHSHEYQKTMNYTLKRDFLKPCMVKISYKSRINQNNNAEGYVLGLFLCNTFSVSSKRIFIFVFFSNNALLCRVMITLNVFYIINQHQMNYYWRFNLTKFNDFSFNFIVFSTKKRNWQIFMK